MFRVPPGYVRTIRPLLKCKTFYTRGLGNPEPGTAASTVDSGYVDLIRRFTFLIRMQLLEADLHTERRGRE